MLWDKEIDVMYEFIGIFGDVVRILTFQKAHDPINNGFAPRERLTLDQRIKAVSVRRIGRHRIV